MPSLSNNTSPGTHVFVNGLQRDADALLVAFLESQRRVEKERIAVAQFDGQIAEALYANLRTLQVTEQADVSRSHLAALRQRRFVGAPPVIVGVPVREVQAGDVHPGPDHLAQRLLAV